MTVDSILSQKGSEVTKIAPDATLKTAADWLRAKNIGALVVTSGDSILGIVSERDHLLPSLRSNSASQAKSKK